MEYNKYRKFLLNRMTCNQNIVDFIENSLVTEDEIAKHSFHKIMICRWSCDQDGDVNLFEALSDYFGVTFIPMDFTTSNLVTNFYTSSLTLVLKIVKFNFMFPHCMNMFSIDILFNDKTSYEFFEEKKTIEDVITYVVSHRFNEYCELNLSNFCNDQVFLTKKINFYKLTLLSHFKILMIRMGRDTKILNLSNNNLSQIPLEILNFFIKGDLIGVNLSNNNIPSISELQRVSSKIEKLWVEGNPLCEDLDAITYIKRIVQKFPRLTELDGVILNEHGLMVPFYKNFLITPDKRTKIVVEKFVSIYFAHYDAPIRKRLGLFYHPHANMSISTDFSDSLQCPFSKPYAKHSRNFACTEVRSMAMQNLASFKGSLAQMLMLLPPTTHDPTSFTVDVLNHDNTNLTLVIDGVYREKLKQMDEVRFVQFRRTFIFIISNKKGHSHYQIIYEMFSARLATPEIIKNYFKYPMRHQNQLSLFDPDLDDQKTVCNAFIHITQIKRSEAEAILKRNNWDIKLALKEFHTDFKNNVVNPANFVNDDFSDVSSLLDDDDID